jgi:hypothetical protein
LYNEKGIENRAACARLPQCLRPSLGEAASLPLRTVHGFSCSIPPFQQYAKIFLQEKKMEASTAKILESLAKTQAAYKSEARRCPKCGSGHV